jgi:hypothetical protein
LIVQLLTSQSIICKMIHEYHENIKLAPNKSFV